MNALVDKPPTKDKAVIGRTLAALRVQVPKISSVMGLFERNPADWLLERRDRAVRQRGIDPAAVDRLIQKRSQARACRNFQEADRLRDELKSLGVEVIDKPMHSTWKVAT
jgi:cysteinyl-tRNA synthetase